MLHAGIPSLIALWATTDAATVINLCHHSYFNLDGSTDILDHTLTVHADAMTAVDADLIPTGDTLAVAGSPFDFRTARRVRLGAGDGQRVWYDHNFVLRRDRLQSTTGGMQLAHAATLASSRSGLSLQAWTTEPALHVYDGFKLNVPVPGLAGTRYGPNAGLCLEPQHYPDSPNHAHFPPTTLRPDELYRQVTEYRFLDL
jgi:aldose 1-epimerase